MKARHLSTGTVEAGSSASTKGSRPNPFPKTTVNTAVRKTVDIGDTGPDFGADIAELEALDLGELRIRYRKLFRKTPPPHLPRWLLLQIVAYQLQVRVLGDLDTETVKLLVGLARAHEKELRARDRAKARGEVPERPKSAVPEVPAISTRGRLAIGTELVREHAGELHRVIVTEAGFLWRGRAHASLSNIAKLITGTNWNGPAFFGLRQRRRSDTSDQG